MKNLILVFVLISAPLFASEKHDVVIWGKVFKQIKKTEVGNFKYYLKFKVNGEIQVFPIEHNKNNSVQLESSLGKTIKIQGLVVENRIYVDRQPINFYSIKTDEILALSMGDLRPKNGHTYKRRKVKEDANRTGGITLDDDVANTSIFVAGAALLASMFLN